MEKNINRFNGVNADTRKRLESQGPETPRVIDIVFVGKPINILVARDARRAIMRQTQR